MREIWITKAGPPEVLEVREAPDPEPKAGEVRIRVEATGVNFADIMGRLGIYPDLPPMPVVPGYEVGGRIDAVGTGVEGSWVGRDVLAVTRFGGYADTVCVPTNQVFARPANMSALEAAAIPVNYFTAWQLVVVMGSLKAGETVLIHSAGGGVGIAATQLAKHIGAKVIGTASAAKHAELCALGVDHLIDYRTEDFEVRTREITNGHGVELILDAVGGEFLEERLSRTGADRPARHVRFVGGRDRKEPQYAVDVVGGCEYAVVSVQPAVSDEREQRCVRRQPRPLVGRNRSPARMGRADIGIVGARRYQAEDCAHLWLQ